MIPAYPAALRALAHIALGLLLLAISSTLGRTWLAPGRRRRRVDREFVPLETGVCQSLLDCMASKGTGVIRL